MRRLASRLDALKPSGTLAMDARARALASAGEKILNLSAGQPDFPTPSHIIEAATRAMRAGQTRYTDAAGTSELRATIAGAASARSGRAVQPEDVVVSAGVKQALMNVLLASVGPGDEVVIPTPAWGTYAEQVRLTGATPAACALRAADGFQIRSDLLERAITPRTAALVVNSPCNPTGAVHDTDAVAAIERAAESHDLLVLSDEIYDRIVYAGAEQFSLAAAALGLAARTVVLNGVSKAYAMTGWRIGWAVGPRAVIQGAIRIQEQMSGNASSVSQAAALAALTGTDEPVRRMVDEFAHRRRVGIEALAAWPSTSVRPPDGAFYLFPRVEWDAALADARGWGAGGAGLAAYLLETARVALVPGEAFDGPGYLRVSFAAPERDLVSGLARVAEALEQIARGEMECRRTTTSV